MYAHPNRHRLRGASIVGAATKCAGGMHHEFGAWYDKLR
jgi:hypothetical protein